MTEPGSENRILIMEARVNALSATLKSVLATLVLRGILNRADVAALVQETASALDAGDDAGAAELRAIEGEMPAYLRAALGPPPAPDDDDH